MKHRGLLCLWLENRPKFSLFFLEAFFFITISHVQFAQCQIIASWCLKWDCGCCVRQDQKQRGPRNCWLWRYGVRIQAAQAKNKEQGNLLHTMLRQASIMIWKTHAVSQQSLALRCFFLCVTLEAQTRVFDTCYIVVWNKRKTGSIWAWCNMIAEGLDAAKRAGRACFKTICIVGYWLETRIRGLEDARISTISS